MVLHRLSGLNTPKKIAVFYPYFLPAYKAGGPIQSIANMCRQLSDEYRFYIICGDADHTERKSLPGIKSDVWNDFENKASVYYLSANAQRRKTIRKLIQEINPDYVFVNGLYSPLFSVVPLLYGRYKKILSVRGMLHPGALSQKTLKKKLFLSFLRGLRVHERVTFHATDEKERDFVYNVFGKGVNVKIAQNFPVPSVPAVPLFKKSGVLKMLSIALISPMKNHALVLQALQQVKSEIQYDVYGPVKDEKYWAYCTELIKTMPANVSVNYKGSLPPEEVLMTLSRYHCFILPSKSENFGHALYESLLSGVPIITSRFTPWNDLQGQQAGWNVDIDEPASITQAIESAAALNDEAYRQWHRGAVAFAQKSVDVAKIRQQYAELFAS